MSTVLTRPRHPLADKNHPPCDGSGYRPVENFDPLEGERFESIEVCECVIKAKEERHGDRRGN